MLTFDLKTFRSLLIILLLAAVLWVGFGPVQIGGPVSYVIISGNSMEPEIHQGDLVVARRAPAYGLGQAVVYQHPQIGFVYHRVVDLEGEVFILKGDNNDWLDSYHPSEKDILGKYWFALPGVGNLIRTLRQPVYFVSFTLIILFIGASLFLFSNNNLIPKKVRGSGKNMKKNQPLSSGDTRQELLLFIGVLAIISMVFGVISFTKPLTRVISDDLVYYQQGDFSYSAQDKDNIYDSDQIQTGEPVYLQLTCEILMDFTYQFIPAGAGVISADDFSGTYQVDAVISDVDGWKRSFVLVPATDFKGRSFQTEMAFDICQAQALILDKEEKTETMNRWYDFKIYPRVLISGAIERLPLEESYLPEISFQMDTNILRMTAGLGGLDLTQEGRIEASRVINNTMRIFGQEISVVVARRIGAITLLFCLLAAALPSLSLYRDWRASDVSRIQVQYHPLLVDIQEGSLVLGANQVVDVASFSDLTKMAERYGAMILHEDKGTFHSYSVQDEQVIYQYVLNNTRGESLFPDVYAFKRSLLDGLKEDQFELYYQPVVKIRGRKVMGVEAFLRWNHPEHGLLYPADFIDLAEEGDLIPEIDSWVCRRVCQQLKSWQEENLAVVPVSINLSPETVMDEVFTQTFSDILLQTICKPELIQIELNRSNQIFRRGDFKKQLTALADLGISLAIDNFATDDANQINQVFKVPIKVIKIDRSVVQDMKTDPRAKQLVGAVAAMAENFQVEVIAQGVESEADLKLLEEQNIEVAQGFYLGKPIQPDELGPLLKSRLKKVGSGK